MNDLLKPQFERNNPLQDLNENTPLVHTKIFNIRWGDMDAFSHVNNTLYFLYAQEARFDFMEENQIAIDVKNKAPIIASTSCNFLSQMHYPQKVAVDSYVMLIQGKKIIFKHVIRDFHDPKNIFAIIDALIVWFDFKINKSTDVPDSVLNLYNTKIKAKK